jgi:hypothetical protein
MINEFFDHSTSETRETPSHDHGEVGASGAAVPMAEPLPYRRGD